MKLIEGHQTIIVDNLVVGSHLPLHIGAEELPVDDLLSLSSSVGLDRALI